MARGNPNPKEGLAALAVAREKKARERRKNQDKREAAMLRGAKLWKLGNLQIDGYGWFRIGRDFFDIMLDEISQARQIADMRIKVAKPQAGRQIAYRIRAELVCCQIYQHVNEPGITREEHDRRFREFEENGNHTLCYWGEAGALIAETPERWDNDPHDWDWSAPTAQTRRERRQADGGTTSQEEQ